ncbi:hypothetical protein ACFE04_003755 [Oxalis oulophora]
MSPRFLQNRYGYTSIPPPLHVNSLRQPTVLSTTFFQPSSLSQSVCLLSRVHNSEQSKSFCADALSSRALTNTQYLKINKFGCQIFSLLSTDDRLNVRQTCSHFYELCNETQVLRNEELVFYADHDTGSALQLLSSSPRKPGVFKSLLEKCEALQSFHLKVASIDESHRHVFSDIRELSENSITFEQVVDFKLHIRRDWTKVIDPRWSNQRFLQFLALFPRVKRLDLKFDIIESFDHLSIIPSDVASDNQFTASCIYDRILALRNQLEKLRLHLNSSEYFCSTIPLLVKILAEIPQVKNVKFHSIRTIVSSKELMRMVQSLPNLCHLVIRDTTCLSEPRTDDTSEYLQLFNVRSSLRTVTHKFMKYFYDVRTGLIREVPYKGPYFDTYCEGAPHCFEYGNKCPQTTGQGWKPDVQPRNLIHSILWLGIIHQGVSPTAYSPTDSSPAFPAPTGLFTDSLFID